MAHASLKVTGINHVVLRVTDMARSLHFYVDVLGFAGRGARGARMSFLRCGEQGLDLFLADGEVHGGKEMDHMALVVEAADLDPVLEVLAAEHISASPPTDRGTVFIEDPDGHQIELIPQRSKERVYTN